MDNESQKINLSDFIEVPAEQEYLVLAMGKKNKQKKNYDKACEKFKSNLESGFIYCVSTPQNAKYFNHLTQDMQQFEGVLIDSDNRCIEVSKDPILGTQVVVQQRTNIVYQDRWKHLININPQTYITEGTKKEEEVLNEPSFDMIHQLIDQEKQKQKKKKKTKTSNVKQQVKVELEDSNLNDNNNDNDLFLDN